MVIVMKLVNTDRSYGYIYLVANCINDKYYIGQHKYNTTNQPDEIPEEVLEAYRKSHDHDMFSIDINYLGSGTLLKSAINRYGRDKFYVEDILDIASCKNELDALEEWWIFNYRCLGHKLYNIAPGGSGGDIISNLPKDKYSKLCELHRYNSLKSTSPLRHSVVGELNPMYGKHHSKESKLKISKSKLGSKMSSDTRKLMSNNRSNNPKFKPPSPKGKIYVNNGEYSVRIDPLDLNDWIIKGFKRGRKLINKE